MQAFICKLNPYMFTHLQIPKHAPHDHGSLLYPVNTPDNMLQNSMKNSAVTWYDKNMFLCLKTVLEKYENQCF